MTKKHKYIEGRTPEEKEAIAFMGSYYDPYASGERSGFDDTSAGFARMCRIDFYKTAHGESPSDAFMEKYGESMLSFRKRLIAREIGTSPDIIDKGSVEKPKRTKVEKSKVTKPTMDKNTPEKPKRTKVEKSKVTKPILDKNSPSNKAAYQKERRKLINKYFK